MSDSARAAVLAGAAYGLLGFAAGFLVAPLRLLVLAPAIGATAAVAVEIPILLAVGWLLAGRCLRAAPGGAIVIGAVGFVAVMLAEAALGLLAFGMGPLAIAATWATPAGALGLAGQVTYVCLPVLRARIRPAG